MIIRHIRVALLTALLLAALTSGLRTSSFAAAVQTSAASTNTTPTMAPMNMSSAQPMTMPTAQPASAPAPAPTKLDWATVEKIPLPVPDKVWSEFNHRVSGLFVLLWGLTALIVGLQWPRKTWFRFVPPLVLLGLVEFLFLRNDPKAWPTGPIGFWESFQATEVLQHRIFVLLLLLIAIVELLRAADRLPRLLQVFALPALAAFGAIFLFFHQHGGPEMQQAMQMSGTTMAANPAPSGMLASMKQIKGEHLWFSILGLGFAATKLLADAGRLPGRLGQALWPLFAVALGIYMLGYSE